MDLVEEFSFLKNSLTRLIGYCHFQNFDIFPQGHRQDEDMKKFAEAIVELEKVDIKAELESHKKAQQHSQNYLKLISLQKAKAYHDDSLTRAETNITKK